MGLLDSISKVQEEEKLAQEMSIAAGRSPIQATPSVSDVPRYYSEVVNLGFNCEISFKISAYFDKLHSYMYSWVYSHDRELLLESLDNMHDILAHEVEFLPQTNMIKCKKYNMSFHIKARRDELAYSNGNLNEEACNEALAEIRSRASHLADKTEALFKGVKSTLFIYKLSFTNDNDADMDYISRLYAKLSELYTSGRFTLLIIIESAHAYKFTLPEHDGLRIATVPNFTNIYNVQEACLETEGWKEIQDEYFTKVLLT